MQSKIKSPPEIQTPTEKQSVKQAKRLPWIIPAQCEGCGACANRCPRGCLKMVATRYEGVEVPWLDDPDLCSGCGLCEQSCAMGAINMTCYTDAARKRLADRQKICEQ